MMAFTQDGQLGQELLQDRDQRMNVSTAEKRKVGRIFLTRFSRVPMPAAGQVVQVQVRNLSAEPAVNAATQ